MLTSETFIIIAFNNGDEKAYEQVFDLYYTELFNFAEKIIKDIRIAEEIVMDVLVSTWKNPDKIFESLHQLRDHLFELTETRSRSYVEYHGKYGNKLQKYLQLIDEHKKQFVSEGTGVPVLDAMLKALDELPIETSQVFMLIHKDRMEYAQVARYTQQSIATVSLLDSIAIKHIRQGFTLLYK